MKKTGLASSQLRRVDVNQLRRAMPNLHSWFRRTARDLPWRRTRDPYAVWVSEVMLQQTQVITVVPYFQRWMEAFPSVTALAEAEESTVLGLWEGLGYYSRARNFHRAARAVQQRFGGEVPNSPQRFRALPGVGPYTAAAVMSIAFDHDLPVIDGNVRRVISRLIALEEDPRRPPGSTLVERLAGDLLPVGTAAVHNQAMMELGALVCTPRAPDCSGCPLADPCLARFTAQTASIPRRVAKAKVPHHQVVVGLVFDDHGRLLIDRRAYQGFLGGLWELPKGKAQADETLEQALTRGLKQVFGIRVAVEHPLKQVQHAYSHFKITLHPRVCRLVTAASQAAENGPVHQWVALDRLEAFPISRADRKVLAQLKRMERKTLSRS